MTRQQLIDKGKIWIVYPDGRPEDVMHEGNKTKCNSYIKNRKLVREVKKGNIRMAKIIFEVTE